MFTNKFILVCLIFFSLQSLAEFNKALDGHAIVCNNSTAERIEQQKYDKALRMQVIEQSLLEDVAEATIQIKLVENPCIGDSLDPAPRTFDGVFVETYVLTVSTSEGQLLFKENLMDLTEKSIETINFGVPAVYAKAGVPLEIGVQVIGRVSSNREMFDPYQGRFGVFIFKFKNEK